MESKRKLEQAVLKIKGKKVWDFRLSESTGSIITFECGNKIERKKSYNELKEEEGEHSFMIFCSWRLIQRNKIITSWKDETSKLFEGVSKINNHKILNLNFSKLLDLEINFEDGLTLELFCDEGFNSNFDCNWFFRDGLNYYSINNYGETEIESY